VLAPVQVLHKERSAKAKNPSTYYSKSSKQNKMLLQQRQQGPKQHQLLQPLQRHPQHSSCQECRCMTEAVP